MMKCLAIAPQPFFSPRGTPLSVYYRSMMTANKGIKIDLLTYGEGTDVNIPELRIIRIPRFRRLGNVSVGPSILKAFLDIFILIWTVALLIRNRYDYVHAHEEAVFFCRFLKPLFGFKLVYDMHSSLPQQLTNFEFTKSKFLIRLFQKLEDSSLRAADVVITICPALASYAKSRLKIPDKHLLIENSIFEPIKLVPDVSDGKEFEKITHEKSEGPSLFIPQGKKYVVYAGTLEPYQGIDILIRAFQKVSEICTNAVLIIVGGTLDQVEYYSQLADQCRLNGFIYFTGRVDQATAQRYNRLASVLVSPRIQGNNTPLKIYELLASGKPMVATNIYSHTQVLNDDVAFLVDPDPTDMAKGIQLALSFQDRSLRISENARKLYNSKYSKSIYEEKIGKMLELLD